MHEITITYSEQEKLEYKAMMKCITKLKKVMKDLPNGNLVSECIECIQQYWNNKSVRDRWITNLANNASSEYFISKETSGMNNKKLSRLEMESDVIKEKILSFL